MIKFHQDRIHLFVDNITDVESEALDQLRQAAELPIVDDVIAAMPDVHAGKGYTVGAVIPTRAAVVPSMVGVDLGCGMLAVPLNLTRTDLETVDLEMLKAEIEKFIPVGPRCREETYVFADRTWQGQWAALLVLAEHLAEQPKGTRLGTQLGTLGGGNHFIELCTRDDIVDDHVWLMLHSGSRNTGKVLGEHHMRVAKQRSKYHRRRLPNADLGWLDKYEDVTEYAQYLHDLRWAQQYAYLNRMAMYEVMLELLSMTMGFSVVATDQVVNCHHNYVEMGSNDLLITRKGAISAKLDEWGIIPGSMGKRSFITQGLGNADSWSSSSHGAGRTMSRTAARLIFINQALEALGHPRVSPREYKDMDPEIRTWAEEKAAVLARLSLETQTEGVVCRKDFGVIDEMPEAYKDIDAVMRQQADLTTPRCILKQFLCVKG